MHSSLDLTSERYKIHGEYDWDHYSDFSYESIMHYSSTEITVDGNSTWDFVKKKTDGTAQTWTRDDTVNNWHLRTFTAKEMLSLTFGSQKLTDILFSIYI